MKRLLGILILFSAIFSCAPDDPDPDENDYHYFPLNEGTVYVYRVDSYDYEKIPYDTVRFWLREEVGPVVEGLNGQAYSEMYVYRKNRWEGNWQKIRTDLARNTEKFAERYTENVNYIKLAYPISLNTEWHATPFNDVSFLYGPKVDFSKSKIIKAHDYQIVGERGFDSTLHIVYFSSSSDNIIDRAEFRERYANHVGLYKKVELNANFQPVDPGATDTTGNFQPNSGYKYVQLLVDFRTP